MKKALKFTAVILTLVMTVMIFSACSTPAVDRPEYSGTVVDVSGSCNIEMVDGKIRVTASSNIADGTICRFTLTDTKSINVAKQVVTKSGESQYVDFEINDGFPNEVYGFFVAESSKDGSQPEEIYNLYGSKFENMSGENVMWDDEGVFFVLQSEKLTIGK